VRVGVELNSSDDVSWRKAVFPFFVVPMGFPFSR